MVENKEVGGREMWKLLENEKADVKLYRTIGLYIYMYIYVYVYMIGAFGVL